MELEVPIPVVEKHLLRFFPSLTRYPDRYLSLVFHEYNTPTEHLAYLCPICLENCIYWENKKIGCSAPFSLDHYPPQNVGGTSEMLVCKSCNNMAGHAYENSFKETVVKEAFNRNVQNVQLRARSDLDKVKGWLHTNVGISEDGSKTVQIAPNQEHRFPKLTEEENATNNYGQGFKMQIQFTQVNDKKAMKAILKTAYLYCFDCWGYDFIFSFAGELFRDVLCDKKDYPVTVPTKWIDNLIETNKEVTIPTGLVYIKEPNELMSMFVNIPARIADANYLCVIPVIIPSPQDKDFSEMKRIQALLDANQTQVIRMDNFPFEFKPGYPHCYNKTWEELCKLQS